MALVEGLGPNEKEPATGPIEYKSSAHRETNCSLKSNTNFLMALTNTAMMYIS
jgi:hypothetical protein